MTTKRETTTKAAAVVGTVALAIGALVFAVTRESRNDGLLQQSPAEAARVTATPDVPVDAAHRTRAQVEERLAKVDAALAANDLISAEDAWRDAYALALQSREWEPLVAVGDATLRMATGAGVTRGYQERAREAYRAALTRARRLGSAEGTRHVADRFTRLRDSGLADELQRNADAARTTWSRAREAVDRTHPY